MIGEDMLLSASPAPGTDDAHQAIGIEEFTTEKFVARLSLKGANPVSTASLEKGLQCLDGRL